MFPILFRWGDFSLHAYGLFMAVGFLMGIGLALKEARRQGIPGERILDLALYVIMAALLGSRLFYVAINYPLYGRTPGRYCGSGKGGWFSSGALLRL